MVEPLSPMAHDELNINQQGFNSHDPCPGHGKPSRSEALTQPRRGTGWDRSPLRSFGANIHAFQWGLKIQQHFLYKKMINNKMGMQAITTNVSSENWKGAAFNQWRYRTSRQKHPNGPEIGPAFSSFSMIILFSSRWNLGICHMFTLMVVSFGLAFPLGFMKTIENLAIIAAGIQKCM